MAKKPRSQRRKKGQGLGEEDVDNDNGGAGEQLPEDHTIADSFSTAFSMMDDVDNDFDSDGENGDPTHLDMDHMDHLLTHGNRHSDQAEAAAAAREARLQEGLAAMDEFASEKRSARREARLKKLFKTLSQYAAGPAAGHVVASRQDTLRMACLYSLRQGTPSEQYAACRCLEVTSVILGADQEAWVESVARYLQRAIQVTTKATAVRVAALRAWALTVFVCDGSNDGPTTEQLMDFCEGVAQPEFRNETTPVGLRAAAMDCWALLASSIEDEYLAGQDDAHIGRGLVILPLLSNCLDSPSVDLRSAAGECMALIHESRLNLGVDTGNNNEEDDMENANITAKQFRRGSWEGSSWEVLMDEVKQRIAELAVESGRTLSKKARKEQRATFREFLSTIVDDEAPEEVVSFRNGAQLTLQSWREIIQLNFVRHCLQSGFQIQLLSNETLQAIFGADGQLLNSKGGLSQLEKRLYMSKTSEAAKEAHLDLTRRRDKRENIKNHFLTVDGEDI